MKNRFYNRSIFFKLLAGGLTSILLIALSSLIIMSFFLKNSERSNAIHTITDSISRNIMAARIAEKKFLLSDLTHDVFYVTGKTLYLNEHRIKMIEVRDEIETLLHLLPSDKRNEIKKLLRWVNHYDFTFDKIVLAYREKGFKDWGLLGKWRKAIHDVQRRIAAVNRPGIEESLLQLRRLEKDYLLRGDEEYIRDIMAQLKRLQLRIAQIDETRSNLLLKELETYADAFKKYVAVQKKIGRTDAEGLQHELFEAVSAITPVTDKILFDSRLADRDARRSFIQGSLFAYLSGIVLGSILLYLFARSMSVKLGQLKDAVLNVGKGQLDTKIPIQFQDEFGIVSAEFNKMTEALKKLTVSRNYMNKIIESMADTLIVIDQRQVIEIANRAASRLLGYPAGELVGRPVDMIFGRNHALSAHIARLERREFIHQIEETYLGKDGRKIPVIFSCSKMGDNGGRAQGFVCIAQDNTERKRAEEILKRSDRQLRLLSSKILSAQEDERKRIAQELHDGIGQSLTGIKFMLEKNLKYMKENPNRFSSTEFEAIITMIQTAIDEIRNIAMGLRPSSLDDLGLEETIHWFCEQFSKIYSTIRINIRIHLDENRLAENLKTVIFRVLQEALNNVAKHSRARSVQLELQAQGERIELLIADNGTGFALEHGTLTENSDKGFGLASMRERTELSGGRFMIETAPGKGTAIKASWPCRKTSGDYLSTIPS